MKTTNPTKKRIKIEISGIVQGVGFRPTVYRYAVERNLSGYVRNTSSGVVIEVEGDYNMICDFLSAIEKKPPFRAKIQNIQISTIPLKNKSGFYIYKSKEDSNVKLEICPDIATCTDCLKEMFDPLNRRYLYPFINCINCGPRFTIIKNIPYDRKNTTMKKFKMCKTCGKEYENPIDRRFHTQPNCCFDCGPFIKLIDRYGKIIETNTIQSLTTAAKLLENGYILAIKGLGGFHLACDGTNFYAVEKLREGKKRIEKPFALMAKNINIIKEYCKVIKEEEKLLLSPQSPILLLKNKKQSDVAKNIAPGNNYLGIMLPYTPLHHLLFAKSEKLKILVMTSGNISDEPIVYENKTAFEKLKDIADYFLIHNRDIQIGCDDSVTRIIPFTKKEFIIRRSRGYTPLPIKMPFSSVSVFASGADLKNTFAFTRKDKVFISQHIGDMENLETLDFFRKSIKHFKKILKVEPEVIAYDMHPYYFSSGYAKELIKERPLKGIPIQHHHAHICSCMIDNFLPNKKVIGVAFDGTGYGEDGNIWGAEFLVVDYKKYERVGHLKYIPLPGGEKAINQVWRVGVSYLYDTFGKDFLNLDIKFVHNLDKGKLLILEKMLNEKINSPFASSIGRFFDAVSSICGIRDKITYEGQAAIELEMAIGNQIPNTKWQMASYGYKIKKEKGIFIIEPAEIIIGIVDDLKNKVPISHISYKFHISIIKIIIEMCKKINTETNISDVVLSGGVFQNLFLLEWTIKSLEKEGFKVYIHKNVPTNDSGISLGQAVIGAFTSC